MKTMILIAAAAVQSATITPAPITPAEIQQSRRMLEATLVDYPAARFRDVHGAGSMICGHINMKNRSGGYNGWTRFLLATGDDPVLYVEGRSGREDIMVQTICSGTAATTGPDYSARLAFR